MPFYDRRMVQFNGLIADVESRQEALDAAHWRSEDSAALDLDVAFARLFAFMRENFEHMQVRYAPPVLPVSITKGRVK